MAILTVGWWALESREESKFWSYGEESKFWSYGLLVIIFKLFSQRDDMVD
jgi:hypothetical protein